MKIAGIVLAGGLSRRMGGSEKSFLQLGDRTLIESVASKLAPQTTGIAINANGDPARFDAFGYPVIADSVAGSVGPLAGILTGMEWASERELSHLVTAASDTPFFPDDFVAQLSQVATDPNSIAMASSGGRIHPVFGLWPTHLATALKSFLVDEDKRKILEFARRYDLHEVTFKSGCDGDPFFNINTPEDLSAAEARLVSGHG